MTRTKIQKPTEVPVKDAYLEGIDRETERRREEAEPAETSNAVRKIYGEGREEELAFNEAADDLEEMVKIGVNRDFARVVTSVHSLDLENEHTRLKKALEPDGGRSDYATMYAYADACESNARRAFELLVSGRLELLRLESESERIKAGMRESAAQELQQEVTDGTRSKAPTKDDIEARMRTKYGDEFTAQARRLLKGKSTVDYLEHFAELWKIRCRTAQTMLAAVRK